MARSRSWAQWLFEPAEIDKPRRETEPAQPRPWTRADAWLIANVVLLLAIGVAAASLA